MIRGELFEIATVQFTGCSVGREQAPLSGQDKKGNRRAFKQGPEPVHPIQLLLELRTVRPSLPQRFAGALQTPPQKPHADGTNNP